MPHYAIHAAADPTGKLDRLLNVPEDQIEIQLQPGETYTEVPADAETHDTVNVSTGELVKGEKPEPLPNKPAYKTPQAELRAKLYPTANEQFDLLYHDIKDGHLGEQAKQSRWFKRIDVIKTAVPMNAPVDPSLVYFMESLPDVLPVDGNVKPSGQPSGSANREKYLKEAIYSRKKATA